MAGVTEHSAPRGMLVPTAPPPSAQSILGGSFLLPAFGLQPAPPLLDLQTFPEDDVPLQVHKAVRAGS